MDLIVSYVKETRKEDFPKEAPSSLVCEGKVPEKGSRWKIEAESVLDRVKGMFQDPEVRKSMTFFSSLKEVHLRQLE